MIPNEAVEAAARAWIAEFEPLDDQSLQPPTETEKRAIRAALEAAIPHLLGDPVAWRWHLKPWKYGDECTEPGKWFYSDREPKFSPPLRNERDVEPLYAHPTKGGEA